MELQTVFLQIRFIGSISLYILRDIEFLRNPVFLGNAIGQAETLWQWEVNKLRNMSFIFFLSPFCQLLRSLSPGKWSGASIPFAFATVIPLLISSV